MACGICRHNLNQWRSVLCRECNMYILLQKKCSGLESVKQYNTDYRCPRCLNNGDAAEINNHHNEQIERVKTAGRKRKTTEKGLPLKVSPMRKVQNWRKESIRKK